MIDLSAAVQDGFFALLNVPEVTGIAPVFQHVPDDRQPPIVIIGDMAAEPIGGKDGGMDRFTVEVITVRREPRRAALFALMAAVRRAVAGEPVPAPPGVAISRPLFEGQDDDLAEDGVTYLGTQRFSVIAQAV